LSYPIARTTLFPLIRLIVKTIEGIERVPTDRPCIIAANHLGLLDPVILGTVVIGRTKRKIDFLVDPANRYWRYIGRFTTWWTHAIPVDHVHHHEFFARLQHLIKKGDSIGIFPEGEISKKHHLLQPKIGAVKIAHDTGAPIIPVGLRHTELSPLQAILRRFRGPEGITIKFGDPIFVPKSTSPTDFEAISNDLMRTISRLSGIPYAN